MPSINERLVRRHHNQQLHHHLYEDVVMGDNDNTASHDEKHNKGKRKGVEAMPWWALVVVAIFVVTGILLAYILLHHQHRKVALHVMRHPWAHGGEALRLVATRKRHNRDGFHHHFYSGSPRFVTVVMPSVVNPTNRERRLEAIHDTWGPLARAIFVLHNSSEFPKAAHLTISDVSRPNDQYLYPQNLLLPSTITVDDGIPRLYHTIRTIYEEKNPDFAFFVNDHTYVIPEHLCLFLEGRQPEQDFYAGHALKNENDLFNSGAAGYVLSRETMRKLVAKWDEKDPECWVDDDTPAKQKKWLQGNPGLVTVTCLSSMGITAIDTRERHIYHRFHAFPLTRVVSGDVDGWYQRKHQLDELPEELRLRISSSGFDSSYSTLLSGPDCCADESISFHYVEDKETKALFVVRAALLNGADGMTDLALQELMIERWPTERKEIGFYSRGLPRADDAEAWAPLLATMRKISAKQDQDYC